MKSDIVDAACMAAFIQSNLEKIIGDVYSELTPRQALILLALHHSGASFMLDIQNILGSNQQANTEQFTKLKKNNFVSIFKDSVDGRKKKVELNPSTILMLEKKAELLEESTGELDLKEIMAGLSKVHKVLTNRLLQQKNKKR